jgi:hypothetical protein
MLNDFSLFLYVEDMLTDSINVLRPKFNCIVIFFLQKWQSGYTLRSSCWTGSSRADRLGVNSLDPPRQTGYVARHSRATSSGVTTVGSPGLLELLVWLVAPIGLARLAKYLLSQRNLWRDWESWHMVWHDTWSRHQSRQIG